MFERKWAEVGPLLLTLDGTSNGELQVVSTQGIKAKQRIRLKSNSQPDEQFEVKRVINSTTLLVGPIGRPIDVFSDVSNFLVSESATLFAPEQQRPAIPDKEFERAVYEEEPTVAKRVIAVDQFGNSYTPENRLPVDVGGDISIDGTIEVDLDGFSTSESDSVQITGSLNGSSNSVKYGFVNNLRQQILASHDRIQDIEYADFGTKNQRVVAINYTSLTFPGITAKKQFVYSLVGNRYRRDEIIWSII
jgi:hypothetical protein